MTSRRPQTDLSTTAETAVVPFETLPEGEGWAARATTATEAVGALRSEHAEPIFPTAIAAISEATSRDLETFSSEFATPERAAALHAQALAGGHAEFAAAIRGPRGRRLLDVGLAKRAHVLQRPAYPEEGRRTFEVLAARQLHERGELEPHAEIVGVLVPELEARVAAARQRHEAHAAAELARQEAEQRAAERILAAEQAARRRDLAARISRFPAGITFSIGHAGTIAEWSPRDAARVLTDPDTAPEVVAAIEAQAERFRNQFERARA